MSHCNLGGCAKPSSLLFSHICGPTYARHDFCSAEHQLASLQMEGGAFERPRYRPYHGMPSTMDKFFVQSTAQPEGVPSCASRPSIA